MIRFAFILFLALLPVLTATSSHETDWVRQTAQDLLRTIKLEAQALEQDNQRIVQEKILADQRLAHLKQTLKDIQEHELKEVNRHLKAKQELQKLKQQKAILQTVLDNCQTIASNQPEQFFSNLLQETGKQCSSAPIQDTATAPDGTLLKGQRIQLGPFNFFQAKATPAMQGILMPQSNDTHPIIFADLTTQQNRELQNLFHGNLSTVPLDPSGGKALSIARQRDSLLQHLQKGGLVVIPLLILGAVAVLVVLAKLWQFMSMDGYLSNLRILAEKHASLSADDLEERLFLESERQAAHFEHFLPALAICASAAPLLGLLGTVTGMIHTFSLITVYGTGDARLLSTGISEALITTEIGLAIAIPAILAHAWLSRRLKRFRFLQQQTAISLLNNHSSQQP